MKDNNQNEKASVVRNSAEKMAQKIGMDTKETERSRRELGVATSRRTSTDIIHLDCQTDNNFVRSRPLAHWPGAVIRRSPSHAPFTGRAWAI